MATYKGIQGYSVQKLATDPTATDSVGQLWYNSTTYDFKISVEGAGAWASGGNLNTVRTQAQGTGFGTQTATICAGGNTPAGITLVTESYDGTSWTNLASPSNLTYTAYTRMTAAGGTQTAGLVFGGNPGVAPPWTTNDTEIWNGSTWTETGDMNTTHRLAGGLGTSGAAACCGGTVGPPGNTVETEEFNGSTWAVIPGGNMATSMHSFGSWGSQTAGIVAGGAPGGKTVTELYNGATWSTSPAVLNTGRTDCMGFGSSTAGILGGGDPAPAQKLTESFNGSAWTEVGDTVYSRYASGGAGASSSAGILMGGNPPVGNNTEEWNDPVYTNKVVTVS